MDASDTDDEDGENASNLGLYSKHQGMAQKFVE